MTPGGNLDNFEIAPRAGALSASRSLSLRAKLFSLFANFPALRGGIFHLRLGLCVCCNMNLSSARVKRAFSRLDTFSSGMGTYTGIRVCALIIYLFV